jgi:haloalkane dehalogenase
MTPLLERYRASGRAFTAAGIGSFVLDQGPPDGEAVVCVHGVPASAYLYRKVLPALAARGLRGIAIDFPGLGFAERPADADYTWTGLEVAAAEPDRVRSLTILNTTVAVESFHRPWVMEPFAHPVVGEAWLSCVRLPGMFVGLMQAVGVTRRVPADEIAGYVPLLLGNDRGRAFLQIMRGFEATADKQRLYLGALRNRPYPAQVVWGARDRMLSWRRYGVQAQLAAGLEDALLLPGKHFVQEDCPEEIADAICRLARTQ